MDAAEMRGGGGGGGTKPIRLDPTASKNDRLKLKKQTLEAAMVQFQHTIELLNAMGCIDDDEEGVKAAVDGRGGAKEATGCSPADEFRDLLRSSIEWSDFLEKLKCDQASISESLTEESSSWDIVNRKDIWGGGKIDVETEDYLLVSQEDVVDGIASYMAAYLLSVKETKDLTPDQIQDALSKTFSVKKKKGIVRKAWDGSKVIYNVASWGATAIGIYQNPAIVSAASSVLWNSCSVISKLF